MRSLSWIGPLGLLASAPVHAATEAKVLGPSSPWTLDYGDERCSLIRTFGTGDDLLKLQIDSYGSRADFRVLLAGRPVPRASGPAREIRFAFPFETAERERVNAINGRADSLPSLTFNIAFAAYEPDVDEPELSLAESLRKDAEPHQPSPDFERQVRDLAIEFTPRNRVQLNLGEMTAPLSGLRECIDDLKAHWGLDPEQERTLTRHPIADPSSVKRLGRSYPSMMAMDGQGALVPVRIMVDAAGLGTDCVVQIPLVQAAFQDAVCDRLAQRFSPALDKDGRPVASVYWVTVIFQVS